EVQGRFCWRVLPRSGRLDAAPRRLSPYPAHMRSRLAVFAAFILVLVLPLFVRALSPAGGSAAARRAPGQRALVIITPHVEQISFEFGQAFVAWHERVYHEKVFVDWRGPLGTSEIMKQLEAQSESAARRGDLKDDGSFERG